jgi:hypothetical protein
MMTPQILQDPAEGSRETVEHELARESRRPRGESDSEPATLDDAKRLLGDTDEGKIAEVLAVQPTIWELEQAAIWHRGDGDVLGKAGYPLSGKAARVFEILSVDDEDDTRDH